MRPGSERQVLLCAAADVEGVRIGKDRWTESASFADQPANLAWSSGGTPSSSEMIRMGSG